MSLIPKYIFDQVARHNLSQEEAKKMINELKIRDHNSEDIAIIGISCRLPKSKNVNEYWHNLIRGVECKTTFQKDRLEYIKSVVTNSGYSDFLSTMPLNEDELEDTRISGYLEDVDKFDAGIFNISPIEAKGMDPMHRVLLETVWTAIVDAGYTRDKIYGTDTSVFVGRDCINDTMYKYITKEESTSMTGNWPALLAGRINHLYNLKGSSLVIDSACSSGLLGVHLACNALRNNECHMAIVSAVALASFPYFNKFPRSMMESKNGKVKTFDKDADGTLFSEGVASVILKPLSKAEKDRDNIYGVIKGSAINNDGATNGITAPNALAQEEVIVKSWKNSNIDPTTIQYIEAHGTGTKLGDPIEIKGITNAFSKYTDKNQFCGIGSAKGNIGHTVAVSGLASLIKVILAMKNKVIPPSINFKELNPFINFIKSPVYLVDKPHKWEKSDTPRRAGISSFGFAGTNCHVIIEEPPMVTKHDIEFDLPYEIFTVSAKTERSLKGLLKEYSKFIEEEMQTNIKNICYTSNQGRDHYNYRIAIIVRDFHELSQKMDMILSSDLKDISSNGVYYGYHKIGSNQKKIIEDGEITVAQHKNISAEANNLLVKILKEKGDYILLSMDELCRLYTKGAKINWTLLYKDKFRRTVELPTYCFERTKYWGKIKGQKTEQKIIKDIKHPLIDICLADSVDEMIFSTTFNVKKNWVLSNHKIMGESVMPGATYIEMARKACSVFYKNDMLELKNVIFLTPLIVREDENKLVNTVVKKEKGFVTFIIASKQGDKWVVHAEGKVYQMVNKEQLKFDLDRIKRDKTREKVKVKYEGKNLDSNVFSFGPRWLNFKEVIMAPNEQLAELEISDEFKSDLNELIIHPALLDNAVNLFINEDDEDTFLPISYKDFKIYSAMPAKFYTYVRKKSSNKETKICDIQLIDINGNIFAEISDYILKRVSSIPKLIQNDTETINSYYRLKWIEKEIQSQNVKNIYKENILVFMDSRGLYNKIINKLTYNEEQVIKVKFGDCFKKINDNYFIIEGTENDYVNLLCDITNSNRKVDKIMHLSSISDDTINSYEDLSKRQLKGLNSVFYLVKGISKNKFKQNLDLILISDYATEVTGDERVINPINAAMIGVGKVVNYEFKNIKCRAFDIDDNTSVENICKEIEQKDENYQVAFRNNYRYVSEMIQGDFNNKADENARSGLNIRDNGVYIVTGGTGDIGLEISEYLASISKVSLILINRSKLPVVNEWDSIIEQNENTNLVKKLKKIKDIEAKGTDVVCYSCDICDYESMNRIFKDIKSKYGKISGVFHCAGVAGEGFLFRKNYDVFNEVTSPKIKGTWLIDNLTHEENLDFLILFSSITAIFGGSGQGDYTAANAYLDSFAYCRNKTNKKTISINWQAWRDVGISAEYGITEERSIFKLIDTKSAIKALNKVVNNNLTNVIPGAMNIKVLSSIKDELPFLIATNIREKLNYNAENSNKDVTTEKKPIDSKVVIKGKGEDYNETEKNIAEMYGKVLAIEEVDLYESFNSLGGDSIMATQLLKLIDKKYPNIVDISDIFTYSSVVELSEYIDKELEKSNIMHGENSNIHGLESKIESLLDNLKSGNIDIEDGLKILKND